MIGIVATIESLSGEIVDKYERNKSQIKYGPKMYAVCKTKLAAVVVLANALRSDDIVLNSIFYYFHCVVIFFVIHLLSSS